jgi:hypothetical protein
MSTPNVTVIQRDGSGAPLAAEVKAFKLVCEPLVAVDLLMC